MKKALFINVVILAGAVVSVMLFVESVLRWSFFLYHPKWGIYQQKWGIYQQTHEILETAFFIPTGRLSPPYRMKPSTTHYFWWGEAFKTNDRGFLGDVVSKAQKDNLLFVGDSVTFGVGVAQSQAYPEQLRRMLPGLSIANMAMPGYNTDDEVVLLSEELGKGYFKPDIVLIQFCPNDFNKPVTMTRKKNDTLRFYQRRWVSAERSSSGLQRFLMDHSQIFFRLCLIRDRFMGKDHVNFKDMDRYEQLRGVLRRLRRMADAQGFKLVFLNIPYRDDSSVLPEQLDDLRRRQIASLNDIFDHVVDLRGELGGASQFWFDFFHPNVQGHELIARRIKEYLLDNRMLKGY